MVGVVIPPAYPFNTPPLKTIQIRALSTPAMGSPFSRWIFTVLCFVTYLVTYTSASDAQAHSSVNDTSTISSFYSDNVIYIHASPLGQASDGFCGSEARPCSLPVAIHRAPPGSIIVLESGVYHGSYHITKLLTFITNPTTVASDGPVVFDGQHQNRIFWFDNVAANIEGVTFMNGLGDGAGCILITRSSTQYDEATSIQKCSFFNCTSASSLGTEVVGPLRRTAAGALAIIYERPPLHNTMEISGCSFINNIGRSHSRATGGLSVHYDNERVLSAYGCAHIALVQSPLDRLDVTSGHGLEGGVLFSRLTNYLYNGKPVYKTFEKANAVRKGARTSQMYIAYCADQNWWAVSLAQPGQKASVTLHNNAGGCFDPLATFRCSSDNSECDSILMARRVYRGDAEIPSAPSHFACQDVGQGCPSVIVEGATGLQSHRNGLYELVKGSIGGRPIYQQVPSSVENKMQWLRYCVPTNEWMLGDDDPTRTVDNGQDCLRGIASAETTAIHPTQVTAWRYWDADAWRLSPSPGGISVSCAASIEAKADYCPILTALNFPTSVVGIQPTLALNTSALVYGRPTYYDVAHSIYLWYCPRFKEWAISSIPAPEGDEMGDCVRSISSPETLVDDPRRIDKRWEVFLASQEWTVLYGGLRLRCSEDCPRIYIEVEWVTEDSGVYEAIGRLPITYQRLYRQISPPFNVIYYSADTLRWSIVSSNGALLYSSGPAGYSTETSPLVTSNWTRQKNAEPINIHTACDAHAGCPVITVNVTDAALYDLGGVYGVQRYLVGDRPVYAGILKKPLTVRGTVHSTAYIYYCAPRRRWVMGPKPAMGECLHWVAAHPSASMYPHVWTVWRGDTSNYVLTCGGDGTTSLAGVAVSDTKAPTIMPPATTLVPLNAVVRAKREVPVTVPVSDRIIDCNFTHNRAIVNSDATASGAVAVLINRVRGGTFPLLVARKITARGNEGLTTRLVSKPTRAFSAGALSVTNGAPYVAPQVMLQDTALTDNRGHTGGALLEHVRTFGARVSMARNYGTLMGGGFSGLMSNITLHACTCRQNTAAGSGGCGWTDIHSLITMSRSDIANNSALSSIGTSLSGGVIRIADSKISDIHHQSINPRALHLISCELSCAKNMVPLALSSGFGCVPEVGGDSTSSQESGALDAATGVTGVTLTELGSMSDPSAGAPSSLVYQYGTPLLVMCVAYALFPALWEVLVRLGLFVPTRPVAQQARPKRR